MVTGAHADAAHSDIAHGDSHTDTAHSDAAHQDAHTDVLHADGNYGTGVIIAADGDTGSIRAVARKTGDPSAADVRAQPVVDGKNVVTGKSWLIGKDPDAGSDWRQEEKGTTE